MGRPRELMDGLNRLFRRRLYQLADSAQIVFSPKRKKMAF
jgi:hypothetical protein